MRRIEHSRGRPISGLDDLEDGALVLFRHSGSSVGACYTTILTPPGLVQCLVWGRLHGLFTASSLEGETGDPMFTFWIKDD
jgi:hypothetical protein